MKVTCNVIRDILPLYVEDMVSEDTRRIVEEHISNCQECIKQIEEMSESVVSPIDTNTAPLRKIKSTMHRKKLQSIVFSIMLTLAIVIVIIGFLTAPEYIPYGKGLVSFIESDNGTIIVTFSEEVTGYNISVEPAEISGGFIYRITTWDSIWNRNILEKSVNNTVLNPDGKKVDAIYYYNADGSEDVLIYGKDQHPSGGTMTLPRLALAYYLLLAFVLAVISGIVLLVFRRKDKIRNVVVKIFLLPVSYIIAHIGIKGFPTSSYSLLRDFFLILLVMIPIYIAFISAINIVREYKRRAN